MTSHWHGAPYPPHDWQARALPRILDALAVPGSRPLVHACTGAGKSYLLAEVCRVIEAGMAPDRVVVISTSRQDLVRQLYADVRARVGRAQAAMYYGGSKGIARVIVTCLPSLSALADRLDAEGLRVGLWVADEAHNVTSQAQWEAIGRLDPAARLAVTATPFRRGVMDDGVRSRALEGWDQPLVEYRSTQAIRDGVLVPPVIVDPVGMEGWQEDDATIEMIRQHAPDGPGIVSAYRIDDADAFASRLTREGIPAAAYSSDTSATDRRRLIRRLESGSLRCLVHPLALTEGVDIRPLRWVALRAPRNPLDLAQEIGRGLRRSEDRWGVKQHCIVLDVHQQLQAMSVDQDAHVIDSLEEWEEREAAKRRERIEREAEEREQALVMAVSRQQQEIRQWACLVVARGWVDVPRVGPWRLLEVSPGQRAELSGLLDPQSSGLRTSIRWLPEALRDAVREVAARPDLLTRGGASDTLALLQGVRAQVAAHMRAGGGWRRPWRWPADMSPVVTVSRPDAAAG